MKERFIDELTSVTRKDMRRHIKYSPLIAQEILEFVASGGTIKAVCEMRDHLPHFTTVYDWSDYSQPECRPNFADAMRRAEQKRTRAMAEQIIEWSNPNNIDTEMDTKTSRGWMPTSSEVQKYDMCIRSRLNLLSKLDCAKFGQNPHNRVTIKGNNAAEKLISLVELVSSCELSTQAGSQFAQLIKAESDAGELKVLADAIKELAKVADNLKNGIETQRESINAHSDIPSDLQGVRSDSDGQE